MARYDKKDEPAYLNAKPPEALHRLTVCIAEMRLSLPSFMPQSPGGGGAWWIAHQEPMTKEEWPRRVNVAGKDGMRWLTPYIDRLEFNLRTFLQAKLADQNFIIAAFEDGIWWRGDGMEFFYAVCNENLEMQKMGRDAYIAQAKTKARPVINKINISKQR